MIFNDTDHQMWQKLYKKQIHRLKDVVNPVFLDNLKKFKLPIDRVPTLNEISEKMYAAAGWRATPVNGLIGYDRYFSLLKDRLFPTAMFMRQGGEEDLSKDPDFFHEVFGHCTMLLSMEYANFMHEYAKFALTADIVDRPLFARLIWFTTETALLRVNGVLKIYGSSIISSYTESFYCLNSNEPVFKSFNVVDIFREPYRADLLQKVYYILDNVNQLYNLLDNTGKLYQQLKKARELGEFPAAFTAEHSKYANIGHCK